MPVKQISFRRIPGDDALLNLIGETWGIDNTAIFRIAIRELAYRHGFALTDSAELLLSLRDMLLGCKLAKVQGMDKIISRAEKVLKRNEARLQKVVDFESFPDDIERLVNADEKQGRANWKKKRAR